PMFPSKVLECLRDVQFRRPRARACYKVPPQEQSYAYRPAWQFSQGPETNANPGGCTRKSRWLCQQIRRRSTSNVYYSRLRVRPQLLALPESTSALHQIRQLSEVEGTS